MLVSHGDLASAHFPLVVWQSATEHTWTKVSGFAASPQQCLSLSAALTNHSQTQPAEERAHLVYASTSQCVMKDVRVGTLSRILGAGAEAEAVEEGGLLACSVCFLCTLGPPAQRQHHPRGLDPSTSFINQKNVLQTRRRPI